MLRRIFASTCGGTVKLSAPAGATQTKAVVALLGISTPPPATNTVAPDGVPVQLRGQGLGARDAVQIIAIGPGKGRGHIEGGR